ncbi:MAG: hypothetical protein EHM77_02595, partial [Planctomycetaceae bacterium]
MAVASIGINPPTISPAPLEQCERPVSTPRRNAGGLGACAPVQLPQVVSSLVSVLTHHADRGSGIA